MEDLERSISESFAINHKYFAQTTLLVNEAKDYKRVEEMLQEFLSLHISKTGNQVIGGHCLEYILKYSKMLEKYLEDPKKLHKKSKREKVTINLTKLHMLVSHIKYCFILDKEDFDSLPEDHERKQAIRAVTTTIDFDDKKELQRQLEKFFKTYNLMKAVMSRTSEYKPSIWRNLLSGWLTIYYSVINKKKGRREAKLFDSDGNIEGMKLLWELTESKLLVKLLPIAFVSINFNQMIYIPRLSPNILEDYHKPSDNEVAVHYTELIAQEPILAGAKYTLSPDPGHVRVPIRIISPIPLHKIQHELLKESSCTCCSSVSHEGKKFERLIIHFHGGGYLSQTSFSHQSYSRIWANKIGEPIFSIDYRLAPENPFPDGIDDAWQAYTWLVKYSHKFLGVVPHKIIVVGDSAGGNFVTSLTLKCIQSGFRPPDAVFMIYPALSMAIEHISKGALSSLEDQLLSHGIFYVLREAYLKGKYPANNVYVSPVHCDGALLDKFPKTEMIVTLNDPLSGDALRFADRLIRHGRQIHITEYPDGIHGVMSLGNRNGVPMYARAINDAVKILKELIE
ncbi:hypothetical protein SteCoe_37414 [Stentor coeruleus]|uniref:Alpha/beta hydrolase fold-3 domain-containing protein n=1 Tax=Stentor coeruleus TaxID=5963 RepID=A0A1R2AN17_9CILI|nr:hypothetical protein SteCoe_37414 [Stentor coeruleus]